MLSLNVIVDQLSKEQFLATATSIFIDGAVMVILLIAVKIIGRLLSKTKETKPGTHIARMQSSISQTQIANIFLESVLG